MADWHVGGEEVKLGGGGSEVGGGGEITLDKASREMVWHLFADVTSRKCLSF